ncbi:helix-turn-helix domain-containing protein [Micromonospora sp. CB01531]|uniref:helix-turn-helix domain-containing protein n=1 Tax=Micromonospora sp. CB01531 TaxID=1718947 RepID=UPI00093A29F8|nr:helix-turn-helix domain-containing protein [Micromonospora sp. CB01531]OKI47209.1 hypothetical protein A6A27_10180 [Micromonospora sp. CB01531]
MNDCPARHHGTWYAYLRLGCTHPEARDAYLAHKRRENRRRPYIRGRMSNRGSRRGPVDPMAVDRAVGGDRALRLTVDERQAAIDVLDAQGLSANAIAIRLGISARTVHRRRSARARQMEAGLLIERFGPLDDIENESSHRTEEARAA